MLKSACILFFSQQEALLEDLRTDIPVRFNFLFSDSHVEVISGKQEGELTHFIEAGKLNTDHSDGECHHAQC